MSFYDDASLVFLAAGAAGKDGKAYSLKPTDGSGDFTFTRGTNLTATRVGKDGYIEKGRTIYTLNTVWAGAGTLVAPTGWNDTQPDPADGDGSYAPVAGSNGQIKFEVTDATDATANERYFLQSTGSAVTTTGIYATSVYVDAVTGTAPAVRDVVISVAGGGGSKTKIGFFKNDTEAISDTTTVEAGNRYTYVAYISGSGYHRFGLGTNGDINSNCSVTLSRPQIETGLVSTEYRENTSTTDVVKIGLLEDEPRFDYTGGGCPALLLEPTRTNYIEQSEYVKDTVGGWEFINYTITNNAAISPEGVQNAVQLDIPSINGYVRNEVSVDSSTDYVWSFYVKAGTATELKYSVYDDTNGANIISQTSYYSQVSTDTWVRIEVPFTTPATCTQIGVYFDRDSQGNGTAFFYGAQLERGSYATSYMPNYGAAATVTRAKEYNECSFSGIGSQGTVFGEVEVKDDGVYGTPVALSDGDSTTNFILVYKTDDNKLSYRIRTGGADQGSSINTAALAEGNHKFAFRFKENDCDFFVGGVLVGSNTTVTIPTGLDSIRQYIGTDTNKFHGGTKQLLYFPTVLSNNDSEILTGATSYNSFADMATSTDLNYTIYE